MRRQKYGKLIAMNKREMQRILIGYSFTLNPDPKWTFSCRGTWYKVHFSALRISLWLLEVTDRCDTSTGACQSPELSLTGYTGTLRKPLHHPVFEDTLEVLRFCSAKRVSLSSWQLKKTLRDNTDSAGFTGKNVVSNRGKTGIQTKEAFTSNTFSSFCL